MKKKTGVAVLVAALLAVNSASVVFAQRQSGAGYGEGHFEGNIKSGILNIELPLESDSSNPDPKLGFILDPNDLIGQTRAARYGGASFDSSCFYFKNFDEDGNVTGYSNKSDDITAINRTLNNVSVSVSATLSDFEGISLTNVAADFDSVVSKPTISVLLEDSMSHTGYITGTDGNVTAAVNEGIIPASNQDAFIVTYSAADDEYRYSEGPLAEQDPSMLTEYSFHVVGTIAKNDGKNKTDWSEVDDSVAPKLELIWSFKDEPAADELPGLEKGSLELSSNGDTVINFSLGGSANRATGIAEFVVSGTSANSLNKDYVITPNNNYIEINTVEETITFKRAFAEAVNAYGGSGSVAIKFNDTNSTTANLSFTVS